MFVLGECHSNARLVVVAGAANELIFVERPCVNAEHAVIN